MATQETREGKDLGADTGEAARLSDFQGAQDPWLMMGDRSHHRQRPPDSCRLPPAVSPSALLGKASVFVRSLGQESEFSTRPTPADH